MSKKENQSAGSLLDSGINRASKTEKIADDYERGFDAGLEAVEILYERSPDEATPSSTWAGFTTAIVSMLIAAAPSDEAVQSILEFAIDEAQETRESFESNYLEN